MVNTHEGHHTPRRFCGEDPFEGLVWLRIRSSARVAGQLLRSLSQFGERSRAKAGERLAGAVMLSMAAGDRHGGAAA